MEITTPGNISFKTWLKKVVSNPSKKSTIKTAEIFGVPLYQSLQVACTYIAYDEQKNTVMGYIPIVVAKCGSFLKNQGLFVEGIFRKSGSAKRVGELQRLFSSSPEYGRYLNWQLGYTVHDAANCLRRYLNYLPEPVIVFSLYDPFRKVITNEKDTNISTRIQKYQKLIDQLPIENQYLLLYLLDLLALFSKYAKYTKMDSVALASVFTPGILLNPDHAMDPSQYKLSQQVLLFLIDNQEAFQIPVSLTTVKASSSSQPPKKTTYCYQNEKQQHLLRANTVPIHKNRLINDDPIQQIMIINKHL